MKILFVIAVLLNLSFESFAAETKNLKNVSVSNVLDQSAQYTDKKLTLELFNYEEYVYSRSRKAEVGDQMELTSRFRYQITDEAWMSVGFRTDPSSDRFDNKTSDFEIRAGYNYGKIIAQADLSMNTNDPDGGISFGFDLDSENTFLRYMMNDKLQLTFYPLNFDGEVGVEFRSGDVTRIYYIDGTPNAIPVDPNPDDPAQRVAQKTIPGFELRYSDVQDKKNIKQIYFGLGAATYEYPNDPTFDITEVSTGTTWARRDTFGYKLGGLYRTPDLFASFQYVGQTEDRETGVLLQSAASLYGLFNLPKSMIAEVELAANKAGSQPYRISRSQLWFDENVFRSVTTENQRIYADFDGNPQDWLDEWGSAASLKLGLKREGYTPYLSYKFQDENFVFRSRTSAHNLRTNNQGLSHGGLHRLALGAFIYSGNFIINPQLEYLSAKNNVFTDGQVLIDFDPSAVLTDSDFNFFINVSYFFDKRTGPRTFRL